MNQSRKRGGWNAIFDRIEHLPASDRAILKTLLFLAIASIVWLLIARNASMLVSVPESGGTLAEGIIGTPRFINPLLAVTGADKDMAALVYAGLMKLGPDGTLIPDMAETITISDDGLTYNVVLKNALSFQDGTPVSSDDVLFTVAELQDPALKSPLRGNWDGVVMERVSEREFNFVLSQAYAPFIENLTLGILPQHMWESATPEELPFSKYNSEPIGSGPYMIEKIERNASGIPESYLLVPSRFYHGDVPRIERLSLFFYSNEDELVAAMKAGIVESAASLSGEAIEEIMATPGATDDLTLFTAPLPRTFEVFLNQNEQALFRDAAVREALNIAVPREEIVKEVLGGYGIAIDTPIPPGFGIDVPFQASENPAERINAAKEVLRSGGWKLSETTGFWEKKSGTESQELRFSLATPNMPVFTETAALLSGAWAEVGIPVDVKQYEQSDLTQTAIRPRKYDALLFGTAVGRELDLYSFWHSSQRNDPGLNIGLYANITSDSILANARTLRNPEERKDAYVRFVEEIKAETPAIFLYVPEFTYIAPKRIPNVTLKGIANPSERFSGAESWYMETEAVWNMFADS